MCGINNKSSEIEELKKLLNKGFSKLGPSAYYVGLMQPTLIGNIINDKADPFLTDAFKAIRDKFYAGDYGLSW